MPRAKPKALLALDVYGGPVGGGGDDAARPAHACSYHEVGQESGTIRAQEGLLVFPAAVFEFTGPWKARALQRQGNIVDTGAMSKITT